MKEPKSLTASMQLTEAEAYALADLCKRIGWRDVTSLAVDEDEARVMLQACDRVREALAQVNVVVR